MTAYPLSTVNCHLSTIISQLSSVNSLLYVLFWWAKKDQKSPQTTEDTAPPFDPP
jgi:hypothetical protein